jgi:hypothetical protein
MAQIQNPRKKFNFQIYIPGLNPFLAQNVTLPDIGTEVDEHGDANYKVKTPGMSVVGTCKVEKISIATGSDNWIWEWVRQCQDAITQGFTLLPSQVKRTIRVDQLSVDGITVLNTWELIDAYPSNINGVQLSRVESGNTMEDIDFQVDLVQRL